jgi:putative two-component system response regulator
VDGSDMLGWIGAQSAPGRAPESATVMVVEDDPAVRQTLSELMGGPGYRVVIADSAEQAVELLNVVAPDLILTDVQMGGLSGIELCQRVKADPRYELTPVVLLSAVSDVKARVEGLAAGADDFFSKPVDFRELLTRLEALLRVKFLLDQLERAEGMITTLALTIEARDKHTSGHCERLARYALAVGEALGADRATLRTLRLGGYLHDLGKIAIPDDILLKPGPLDERERERIRVHPTVGADLMAGMKSLEAVRPIVRHHHERWDGSGYPDRLEGEKIPLGARIISVVDVFDSLHTARPYRAALSREAALSIVKRETEAGFWDPAVVSVFLDVLPHLPPA